MEINEAHSCILPANCLRLGSIPKISVDKFESRLLFVFKKDTCDYVGQIRTSARGLLVEMFNSNFFSLFQKPRSEVEIKLQTAVLDKLSHTKSVPGGIRSIARSQLEAFANSPGEVADFKSHVDLDRIFFKLNNDYFGNQVKAKIGWGMRYGKNNRQSICYGSYDEESGLIRINPALKHHFIPISLLELTVYHEMCHQFLPPIRKKGRWFAHHPEFKRKEREYQHFEKAVRWERVNWTRLLKS